ncbi:MAG: hypothetical protein KAQ83_04400 [Nanoarchaeota archaeon]|nr:hypothetical protein [Nanoarchaeota archaeon]
MEYKRGEVLKRVLYLGLGRPDEKPMLMKNLNNARDFLKYISEDNPEWIKGKEDIHMGNAPDLSNILGGAKLDGFVDCGTTVEDLYTATLTQPLAGLVNRIANLGAGSKYHPLLPENLEKIQVYLGDKTYNEGIVDTLVNPQKSTAKNLTDTIDFLDSVISEF